MRSIEKLSTLEPIYFADEHDLDKEVFEPICRLTESIKCMTGYYTSGSLRELACALNYFLHARKAQIQFIVSPNLSADDAEALLVATQTDKNLLPLLFPGFQITEDNLRSRTLESLAYLVISGRLAFKLAMQQTGLFHTKCWIFELEKGTVVAHGSVNATASGFSLNTEQIAIDKDWESNKSKMVVEKVSKKFHSLWNNENLGVRSVDLNAETLSALVEINYMREKKRISERDVSKRLEEVLDKLPGTYKEKKLRVPEWLDYQNGDYSHQEEAISAWISSGLGILSIATGGGKTLTSLVAASLVAHNEKSLLLVIAVPTKALLDQWEKDVKEFSVQPYNSLGRSSREIVRAINGQLRNLRLGVSQNEVVIVTHDFLKSEVMSVFEEASNKIPIMLVGDEVHNLGATGFKKKLRDCFKYRLGLSATAIRQFDEEGSSFLIEYFGPVVYDFSLEDAIGKCLVQYNYFLHRTTLDEAEQDQWSDLTSKIRKLSYASEFVDGNPEKERWKLLCLERRRIIESASGKISALAEALPQSREMINRTLIFATDKNPNQLEDVNRLLTQRGINFHQVTSEETSSKSSLQKIVDSFSNGELQALTSKRVLDEGFNIPQTEVAYFLASNTVRRQWIQRLGRVLRLSKSTNKAHADVHDFIVFPSIESGTMDTDLKGLIRSEYERISFFSNLSMNGLEQGGSIEIMQELLELMES